MQGSRPVKRQAREPVAAAAVRGGIGHILPLPSEWLLHSSGTASVVTGMSHTSVFGTCPEKERPTRGGGEEESLEYSETNLERDAGQTSQDFLVENTLNK